MTLSEGSVYLMVQASCLNHLCASQVASFPKGVEIGPTLQEKNKAFFVRGYEANHYAYNESPTVIFGLLSWGLSLLGGGYP